MRVAIHNIGRIISGDPRATEVPGSAIACSDGVIEHIGDSTSGSFDVVIDARGATAVPGLIDSHVHVTFGDYTPRQQTVGYLASYVHGGVTTAISASEVHVPGRPTSRRGSVALAVAAHESFANHRPGGMRVHGGSLILDPCLQLEDFEAARAGGVWLSKAGFGNVHTPKDYVELVALAREVGMVTTLHVGGASIPSSLPVSGRDVVDIDPHVAFHCNGGPIAMADDDYDLVINEAQCALQLCTAGNLRTALVVAREVVQRDEVERLLLGTDTPTGSGIMPLGLWYTISQLSSLAGVDPAMAIAWATGNNAATYGLQVGRLEETRPADLVLIDAPLGGGQTDALSALKNGDVPGIGAVVIDGVPRFVGRSRNSPPPTNQPVVTENEVRHEFGGVHH